MSRMIDQTRVGRRPKTTRSIPHAQLTQHGPDEIIEKLHRFCFELPDVLNRDSLISVPGARALVVHDSIDCNREAFLIGREFAHIHPHPDNGSMHLKLAELDAAHVIQMGWGEDHFLVSQGRLPPSIIMVYSPRNDEELEVVKRIVVQSYEFAIGSESTTSR
ncbi:MAG: hypothetical protein AAGJ52_14500 [Pseudomonadota bacterium]